MTYNKNSLKHRLMAIRFSIWDLHLYLDTHPCDETAMNLENKYKERYAELLKEYECKYGPLTALAGSGTEWTKAPWPWDNRGDC